MPYIEAKLSTKLSDNQRNELQARLTEAVAKDFSKPKTYIMANIEDNQSLYMAEKKLDAGAYISIKLLGSTTRQVCQSLTGKICDILSDYGIDGAGVYVTYHPVDLWGWNGSMF